MVAHVLWTLGLSSLAGCQLSISSGFPDQLYRCLLTTVTVYSTILSYLISLFRNLSGKNNKRPFLVRSVLINPILYIPHHVGVQQLHLGLNVSSVIRLILIYSLELNWVCYCISVCSYIQQFSLCSFYPPRNSYWGSNKSDCDLITADYCCNIYNALH